MDFLGIERRLQTNLYDFNSLPAKQQLEMDIDIQNIEVGHTPASIRESLLEKVISMGDKFVKAVQKEYPPGAAFYKIPILVRKNLLKEPMEA